MTLLCGVDFSEPSNQAVQIATALARRLGDSLILGHAMDVSGYAMLPDVASFAASFEEKTRDVLRSELEKRAAACRQSGVDVETRLLTGPADSALVALADTLAPRLIIMGTQGTRGVRRLLMGSISEKLADSVHHPVLVVGKNNAGMQAWAADSQRPLRALMALDNSIASRASLSWLRDLRSLVPVDVTFVHFYFPPAEHRRLGINADPSAGDGEVVQALHRDLRDSIGELPGKGSMELRIYPNWVSVAERLRNEAVNVGADILILGAHQRSLWGRMSEASVVQQSLRKVDIPIVCVPVNQASAQRQRQVPELRVVVAATDLTEGSNKAIPYAYAVLRGGGGSVHLVHVCADPDSEKASTSQLRALVPQEAEVYGIRSHIEVIVGKPVGESIAQLAERVGADAICVSSHGRGAVSQALLGSIAAQVGEHTRRPLFLVRPDA